MTVFAVDAELLVVALGRDVVALATHLPLALLLLALCGWPNLVQWLGEGRFTAEVDPRTLRLDRSQVAESWRARGLAPDSPEATRLVDDARPLRLLQARYGTVRTADGALLYS